MPEPIYLGDSVHRFLYGGVDEYTRRQLRQLAQDRDAQRRGIFARDTEAEEAAERQDEALGLLLVRVLVEQVREGGTACPDCGTDPCACRLEPGGGWRAPNWNHWTP